MESRGVRRNPKRGPRAHDKRRHGGQRHRLQNERRAVTHLNRSRERPHRCLRRAGTREDNSANVSIVQRQVHHKFRIFRQFDPSRPDQSRRRLRRRGHECARPVDVETERVKPRTVAHSENNGRFHIHRKRRGCKGNPIRQALRGAGQSPLWAGSETQRRIRHRYEWDVAYASQDIRCVRRTVAIGRQSGERTIRARGVVGLSPAAQRDRCTVSDSAQVERCAGKRQRARFGTRERHDASDTAGNRQRQVRPVAGERVHDLQTACPRNDSIGGECRRHCGDVRRDAQIACPRLCLRHRRQAKRGIAVEHLLAERINAHARHRVGRHVLLARVEVGKADGGVSVDEETAGQKLGQRTRITVRNDVAAQLGRPPVAGIVYTREKPADGRTGGGDAQRRHDDQTFAFALCQVDRSGETRHAEVAEERQPRGLGVTVARDSHAGRGRGRTM